MKLFADTANLHDIEEALKRGFIDGVTTNPSLLAKEPKANFEVHIGKIVDLIKKHKDGAHLSVEVFSTEPAEILRQAKDFIKRFQYQQLSVKIQIGWDELVIISQLAKEGISVNCTACMKTTQAMMAANAGARYVSLFVGRIKDSGPKKLREMIKSNIELTKKTKNQSAIEEAKKEIEWCRRHIASVEDALNQEALEECDFDPFYVIGSVRQLLDRNVSKAEIIAGSIRSANDVKNAALAGAHIVTVPPKFFSQMVKHHKTDEVVQAFMTEFQNWQS